MHTPMMTMRTTIKTCCRLSYVFAHVRGAGCARARALGSNMDEKPSRLGRDGHSAAALYGFVAWIATQIAFALFLLWAYLPESTLHRLGITYYPAKHWALTLPSHLLVSLVMGLVFYWTFNMMRLPPLEDLSTIVDEFSRVPDERGWVWGEDEQIPTVVDLPITFVSKLLHSEPTHSEPASWGNGTLARRRQEAASEADRLRHRTPGGTTGSGARPQQHGAHPPIANDEARRR